MNILIWTLSIGVAVFQAVDFWTTKKILERGHSRELNKVMAWLMDKIGVVPTLIITKGAAAIAVLAGAYFGLWGLSWHGFPTMILLAGLFGFCGVVASHNLGQLNKR